MNYTKLSIKSQSTLQSSSETMYMADKSKSWVLKTILSCLGKGLQCETKAPIPFTCVWFWTKQVPQTELCGIIFKAILTRKIHYFITRTLILFEHQICQSVMSQPAFYFGVQLSLCHHYLGSSAKIIRAEVDTIMSITSETTSGDLAGNQKIRI